MRLPHNIYWSVIAVVLGGNSYPDLTIKVAKGDRWIQMSKQEFRLPSSTQLEEGFTYRTEFSVQDRAASGWRLETKLELLESRLGDTVLPPAKGATPEIEKIIIGPNGERASFAGRLADPIEFRIDRLLWFVSRSASERSNDSWEVSFPGDEGGTVPEANVTFTIVKEGDFQKRKSDWIQTRFSERNTSIPFKATALFIVDTETGLVVHAEVKAKNAIIPGGAGQRYELTITNDTQLALVPRKG